ncbi:MAG: phage tail tape measure protein [bacterium]|nr:phage tail tape measure protein [bacterium]
MAADQELLIRINGTAKNFTDELDRVKRKTKDLEKSLTQVAKVSAVAFAAFAGTAAVALKNFVDFEKALVGVGKTANLEGKRLEQFGSSIQRLSEEIPVATNELLGIAQAAGQLGVTGEENLLKFTETVAKLGVATDLSGEEAATALTRILNVTNESIDTIDTFGSVIVSLGNNFAATESEIVKVATEVSRSTSVFGVTSAQAAALSAALKSVGVQAQLGGSAVGRAFREIDNTIRQGGDGLLRLSQITGIAADELQERFGKDAIGVFQAFSNGIGEIGAAGGSTAEALAQFNLKGDEILKVLPVLAQNSELVGRALQLANDETENATALNEEAARAYATAGSEQQKLINVTTNLATAVGTELAPAYTDIVVGLKDFIKENNSSNSSLVKGIALFIKYGGIITGTVALVSALTLGYLKLKAILTVVNTTLGFTTKVQKAYNLAVGLGARAIALFRTGLIAATTTARGFAAATGIGLVLVALSLLITNFKEARAAAVGTFAALKAATENFSSAFFRSLQGVSELLVGLFTFDVDKVKASLEKIKTETLKASSEIADEAGKAFTEAYNNSIAEAEAPEVPAPEVAETTQPEAIRAPAVERARDTSGGEELLKKEEEAARRIRDIRERQNELLTAQAERAALDRVEIKDAELQRLADEEKKAFDDEIKLKETQLNLLRSIDNLEKENAELSAKDKLNAKEQVTLDANQRELEILQGQFDSINTINDQNAEEQLAKQQERDAARLERIQEQAEEEAALKLELSELSEEQRDLLDEQDIQKAQETILTKREAEKEAAAEQLKENIARRNRFIKDEQKFGTAVAKLNQFFSSEEVMLADQTAGQLVQLTQSKNSQLKSIGKAASLVQIGIKTAEGAIGAYSALAGIPIVGPGLGIAAAAALTAFGAEQAASVISAQRGGIVPDGIGGSNDRIPALLQPGELVVPQALAPDFITAVGRPEVDPEGDTGTSQQVVVGFTDDAIPFIEQKLQERGAIGTGGF